MFFIAYPLKGQVRVFAGRVKIVSHSSCRTSAILKYFCPLHDYLLINTVVFRGIFLPTIYDFFMHENICSVTVEVEGDTIFLTSANWHPSYIIL